MVPDRPTPSEQPSAAHQANASLLEQIGELQRRNAALANSDLLNHLVTESTNDGVWTVEFASGRFACNSRLLELFGFTHQTFGGTLEDMWNLFPERDVRRMKAAVQAHLTQRVPYAIELEGQDAQGKPRFLLSRGQAHWDADGRPVLMAGSVINLTDQKLLRVELERAERLAAVGTLSAGVAHEINNPLAYVLSNLSTVAAELRPLVEELLSGAAEQTRARLGPTLLDLEQAIAEAQSGAHRVRRIVEDLKTFSRGDEGKATRVRVEEVVASAVNIASSAVRAKAQLVVECDPVPPVVASELRLCQVFLNLVINAAQAIPAGAAHQHRVTVRVGTGPVGEAVISVSDTGEGIRPEILPKIFDPFFTTKPIGVGTGLGLSICHGIVSELKGRIEVESIWGKGTTFRVTLPAASGSLRSEAPADAPRVSILKGGGAVGSSRYKTGGPFPLSLSSRSAGE